MEETMDSENETSSGSDSETSDDLIKRIFGATDDEDEEFYGFKDEDIDEPKRISRTNKTQDNGGCPRRCVEQWIEAAKSPDYIFTSDEEMQADKNENSIEAIVRRLGSSDEENEGVSSQADLNAGPSLPEMNPVNSTESKKPPSDFDIMMRNRKRIRDSKKKTFRTLLECGDIIRDVIDQMKTAAEEDRNLQKEEKIATKKLKTLQAVLPQLQKEDLKVHFCNMGLLGVVADWLKPTSGDILPHLNIRNALIRELCDFTCITKDHLKPSGLAKALQHLVRHEDETPSNKEKIRGLLSSWYRSLYDLKDNYRSLTEEERERIVQLKNRMMRYSKEEIQEPQYYYSPDKQILKKSKETFENMLSQPESTTAVLQLRKMKRFGITKHRLF